MAKIYGLGTGPGDVEYLTLKAVRILKEVDYIFVPNNKGKNMALDTITDLIDHDKLVFVDYPMGKMTEEKYKENASFIEEKLGKDKTGAFITIGDPMYYSTVLNTFSLFSKDLDQEFVSGIPSFVAAAGVSKQALALMGEKFMVLDRLPKEFYPEVDSYAILKTYDLDQEKLDFIEEAGFAYTYVERASLDDQVVLRDREQILARKNYISLLLLRRK
ncbi:MAG: precorrin-2 C(20)-methyltransferase [Bacillota bacterium]|nr:precorrin-2 C(20)-methyltransferase [Bacillota bacterium]